MSDVQFLLLLDLLICVASLLDDFSVFLNGLASKAGSPHRHEGPRERAEGVVGDTITFLKSVSSFILSISKSFVDDSGKWAEHGNERVIHAAACIVQVEVQRRLHRVQPKQQC